MDVSNPANPRPAGSYDTPGTACGLAILGNYLHVADSATGLLVFDVSDPTNPLRVCGYDTPGDSRGVAVMGNYAYVADGYSGLSVCQDFGFIPIMVQHPAHQTVNLGDTVVLSGWAKGSPPLNWHWLFNGTNLPGQNDAALRIRSMASDKAGFYSLVASNAWGAVTSYSATLSMTLPLKTALNDDSLTWSNADSAPWLGITETPDGVAVAQSGAIEDNQESWIETTVIGPGSLKFSWKVSSEANIDYLQLLVDGTVVKRISGEIPWSEENIEMSPGNHLLRWAYSKNATGKVGRDSGWVKHVSYVPVPANSRPWIAVEPANTSCAYGATAVFNVTAQGSGLFGYQWYKDGFALGNGVGVTGVLTTTLTVGPAQPVHDGNYFVVVTNAFGSATSHVAKLSLLQDGPLKKIATWPWHAGGSANSTTIEGHFAYVADGSAGLQIFDITNPENPQRIGGCDTPGDAISVAIQGNIACVADAGAGVILIDISNPENPQRIGGYETSGYANGVAIRGDYVYVAAGYNGVEIINISNPSNPQRVGGYYTEGWTYQVAVEGIYAYVANPFTGLLILDISNPASPQKVGVFKTPVWDLRIAVAGNYVYVFGSDEEYHLDVIDISNPASPKQLGQYVFFDSITELAGLAVQDGYAYLAYFSPSFWLSKLNVVDISNPSNPHSVTSSSTRSILTRKYVEGVTVMGKYAYFSIGNDGLQVINISNPTKPQLLGNAIGYANNITRIGNIAYVANGDSGLELVDIGNPETPQRLGGFNTAGYSYDVAVKGNYAYVADGVAGLQVIDIGNPANPQKTGGMDTSGTAYGVAVSGNYAYVADSGSGLKVFDIANPANPQLMGGYDTSGDARGIVVRDNYAFIADGISGLQIIDVRNPSNPIRASVFDTSGTAEGVALAGNMAYVADGASGLQIIDINNPASPVRVGGFITAGYATRIGIRGFTAYVVEGTKGVEVIDISNPASPHRIGGYDTSGTAVGLAITESAVWVADGFYGLSVLQFSGIAPTMVQHPTNQVVNSSERVVLSGWASGTPPLSYQWLFNGTSLAGQTNATLPIDFMKPDKMGFYSLLASNTWGSVTSSPAILSMILPLDAALGTANNAWTHGGAASWIGILNESQDGVNAARSGVIENSQESWIQTALEGPGSLRFRWKVSSEGGGDYLQLWVDNVVVKAITGVTSWSDEGVELSPGNHLLRWSYTKNSSQKWGQDMGWLNQVSYVPVPGNSVPWIVLQPSDVKIVQGGSAKFSFLAQGSETLSYRWYKDGLLLSDDLSGTTGSITDTLTIPSVQSGNSGNYYAVVTNPFGSVTSRVAKLSFLPDLPLQPVCIFSASTNDSIKSIASLGHYVYEVDGYSGLHVVDISNPALPMDVGFISVYEGVYVAVMNNIAYILQGIYGLSVVDVSNPSSPRLVTSLGADGGTYGTSGAGYGVSLVDHYAYITGSKDNTFAPRPRSGLDVFDISIKSTPKRVGFYNSSSPAYGVAAVNNYAYLACGSSGLLVIDVSNPQNPQKMGGFVTGGSAIGVAVMGNYAYVADDTNGMQIIDISNPVNPQRVGGYATGGAAKAIVVTNNIAYVAAGEAGLQIIDVGNPACPQRVGGYDTDGDACGVAVNGNTVCVADGTHGLVILQVSGSEETNPLHLSITKVGNGPQLTLEGAIDTTLEVQYADNLDKSTVWQKLDRLTLTNSIQTLIDSSADGTHTRYYRAKVVP